MNAKKAGIWRYKCILTAVLCGAAFLCACGGAAGGAVGAPAARSDTADTAAAAAARPDRTGADVLLPEADGTVVFAAGEVEVDASNAADGYIMARYPSDGPRVKLRLEKDGATYSYDLAGGEAFTAFPLQMGAGAYRLTLYENVSGSSYALLFDKTIDAAITDENRPFLYPSQYVSYDADSAAVRLSLELGAGASNDKKLAKTLYKYVTGRLTYDWEKAATVEKGYLPDPDATLASGKGICFDYAALMATMLRVQGVPTQLMIGYVTPENIYHAWNRAYYDGNWVFMDATLDDGRGEQHYTAERRY